MFDDADSCSRFGAVSRNAMYRVSTNENAHLINHANQELNIWLKSNNFMYFPRWLKPTAIEIYDIRIQSLIRMNNQLSIANYL